MGSRARAAYTPINKGQFTLETPEREARFESLRGFGVEEAYRENRRRWSEYPRRQHVADYPLHVDVELSSLCNLHCPMCYTISASFKEKVGARLMDYDLFTRIVDECAAGDVYSIRLSLRGESFLHPRIVDAVRYAKLRGIKEVSTLTNGVRLDEGLFRQVMEAGLDWITISFDGLGETYERIRRPAKYGRAVEKIANYARIKAEAGRVKPVVKVQSILPAIQQDPEGYYRVFAPITDMVSANPLIDYLHQDDQGEIQYEPGFTCPQLYQRLVVGADGRAMACANDEEGELSVGDTRRQTLHDIWHGPELQRIRRSHEEHRGVRDYGPCAKCYLPRKTEPAIVAIGTREVVAANYVNRSQIIGT